MNAEYNAVSNRIRRRTAITLLKIKLYQYQFCNESADLDGRSRLVLEDNLALLRRQIAQLV